jgi:hypothetical protein
MNSWRRENLRSSKIFSIVIHEIYKKRGRDHLVLPACGLHKFPQNMYEMHVRATKRGIQVHFAPESRVEWLRMNSNLVLF